MPTVGAPVRGHPTRKLRELDAWTPVPAGWYQVGEVAWVFDVTTKTIKNWFKRGRFPNAERVDQGGQRCLMVPAGDINRLVHEELARQAAVIERAKRERRVMVVDTWRIQT